MKGEGERGGEREGQGGGRGRGLARFGQGSTSTENMGEIVCVYIHIVYNHVYAYTCMYVCAIPFTPVN